jgi:hypothetical protein
MDNYLQSNQHLWNEWTTLHEQSPLYRLAEFKAGASTLRPVERKELTDVAGKTLLHLQCHFGLDTLSWVKGSHQLKLGTAIVRNQQNKALFFQKTVSYPNLDDFSRNSPSSVGLLGYPRTGLRNTYYNFFIQDDWRVLPRLTLNLGLRYDYYTPLHRPIGNYLEPVIQTGDLVAGRQALGPGWLLRAGRRLLGQLLGHAVQGGRRVLLLLLGTGGVVLGHRLLCLAHGLAGLLQRTGAVLVRRQLRRLLVQLLLTAGEVIQGLLVGPVLPGRLRQVLLLPGEVLGRLLR